MKYLDSVPLGRIFLWLSNPRHDAFDSETQAIDYLCEKEGVYALARDIAKFGLNPLERLAVIAVQSTGRGGAASYHVAEGNRRLCALKLLADPDLAPAKLRKSFEKLREEWRPITSVDVVAFDNLDEVRVWLDRIHSGEQGGAGRRSWDAEQKQRFSGGGKNAVSQALLDYAEKKGFISAGDRKGKLTTVQRFLVNDVFKDALGLEKASSVGLSRTRPEADFDAVLKRFMGDLVDGKHVHSRMNKDKIVEYARLLNDIPGVTKSRVEPESLTPSDEITPSPKPRRKAPKKPDKAKHVSYDEDIFMALRVYGNEKLQSLYHSIVSIELDPHTPVVSIGAWAFFETLTACAGRDGASFDSYVSKDRIAKWGLASDSKEIRAAVERVSRYGNTSKHHALAATFNGDQLNNDWNVLKGMILALLRQASND